jgi:alkanesulfonate monooxygenase SsuD/methylene tetrahydromethanopterin reductase-like flavin-dependent oxidoreductase (luciferase family)
VDPIDSLMPGGPVHWGVMLAQGWKGEFAQTGWPGSWLAAQEWAMHAEQLGFDGIWAFDHFQSYPARDDSPVLEAWTALAALSQITRRVVLGTLVSCAAYRSPAITVRMAQNLQVLSAGRFCLGVGAGWDQTEFESLDIPFGSSAERSDQLQAVLHACRAAWAWFETGQAEAKVAEGYHPQAGRKSPLLVGGDGERRTLPAAVAYADAVNWQVGVSEFRRKSRVLTELCEATGRDPGSLRRTHAPNFQLFDSDREFRRWCQDERRGMSAAEVDAYIRGRGALYGTASAIEATLQEFTDAGCSGFMIFCNNSPAPDSLDHLASIPRTQGVGGDASTG